MTGATEAADALRQAMGAPLQAVSHAVVGMRNAQTQLHDADDLMVVLQAVAAMALASEALKQAAENAEKVARAALAQTMTETGATAFQTPSHTVSLKAAARTVDVLEKDLVPAEFWRTPDPQVDRAAISAAIKAGKHVPGATLSNGGAETVQFRKREAA